MESNSDLLIFLKCIWAKKLDISEKGTQINEKHQTNANSL